jgi:hypothetical protein
LMSFARDMSGRSLNTEQFRTFSLIKGKLVSAVYFCQYNSLI